MGLLVCVCVLGVLQLAFGMYVRNILRDCASDGARYGAMVGRTPADGAARARELARASLPAEFSEDVAAEAVRSDGLQLTVVTITTRVPVLGPLGAPIPLRAVGHGIREDR